MLVYKIVEKCKDGSFKFLFHDRKKTFTYDDVLIAEKKIGYEGYNKDGSKKLYLTGIHVVSYLNLCEKYLTYFKKKDNKIIVLCDASNIVRKPNSRQGVMLADQVKILCDADTCISFPDTGRIYPNELYNGI
jgi:hypothetical protein